MYNPFSLLKALKNKEFKDYWFETGTPTFLVETLKRNNYELENMTREEVTADGRMDMLVQTKDYIYIFEFKIDKSADEALKQIEEKQYAKPFEQDGRKLYKIGVNFSSSTRRIEGWKVAY